MNNPEIFDFDPYPKIDRNFGKKSFNFKIWLQKIKKVFENKKTLPNVSKVFDQ